MYAEPSKNRENFIKTFYLFKVIDDSSSAVLVMNDSQQVSACLQLFYARRVNSGKITTFQMVPLFDALVGDDFPHPAAQNFFRIYI